MDSIPDFSVYLEESGNSSFLIFSHRAISYSQLKNYEAALEDYEMMLKLKPGNREALKGKCNVFYEMKEWRKLAELVSEILPSEQQSQKDVSLENGKIGTSKTLSQEKAKMLRLRAQAFISLQEHNNALVDLENLLEIEPTNKYANTWIENIREFTERDKLSTKDN